MRGRVLVIAGSDSGGGAGIQADIKSITALGAFAATAITALTAQNTEGVHGVLPIPTGFLRQQIQVVLRDIGADALKTGMLHDRPTIEAVAEEIAAEAPGVPLVADPVMVAKGGHPLLQPDAVGALRSLILPLAAVITPNLPEAAVLTGLDVADEAGMRRAADALLRLGVAAVLLKGGHLAGPVVVDLLATPAGTIRWESPKIETRHTHGTGCTLASAIAAGLAQGMPLPEATARARTYVRAAMETAPGYGRGHGPLNHAVTFDPGRLA